MRRVMDWMFLLYMAGYVLRCDMWKDHINLTAVKAVPASLLGANAILSG